MIEASYQRFLAIMDELIQRQPFVLGSRPSSADFGLYAQLTQLAKFDPTPAALCLRQAPRVYAWTDLLDDLSGQPAEESAWISLDDAQAHLGPLLNEIGRTYAKALLANAAALSAGEDEFSATIDGQTWVQPTFPYQAKCLHWINAEYQLLSAEDRAFVDTLLANTGCDSLLLGS